MRIYEAWRNSQAGGIYDAARLSLRQVTNLGNRLSLNANIGPIGRRARAVNNAPAKNYNIKHYR